MIPKIHSNSYNSESSYYSFSCNDKSTQTSQKNLFQISNNCSEQNITSCNTNSAPKIFEIVDVEQNPCDSESITLVIKETTISGSSTSCQSSPSRYLHCTDVSPPLSTSDSKYCPETSEYKCHNIEEEIDDNLCEKLINELCGKKTSPCPSFPPKCSISSSSESCKSKNMDSSKKLKCESVKSKPECNIKKCVSKCFTEQKEKEKIKSSCMEKVIGIKESQCPGENPTYFVLEKKKEIPGVQKKSSIQEMIENNPTLNSVVGTVQSFIDTVYQTTKNAVSLVTGDEKVDCQNECCEKKSCNRTPKKCASDNQQLPKPSDLENENINKNVQPAINALQDAAFRIESTLSYVSDNGLEKVIQDYIESKMNQSSSLDKPIDPDIEFNNDYQPLGNSVFENIKTKIYSLFRDYEIENVSQEGEDSEGGVGGVVVKGVSDIEDVKGVADVDCEGGVADVKGVGGVSDVEGAGGVSDVEGVGSVSDVEDVEDLEGIDGVQGVERVERVEAAEDVEVEEGDEGEGIA